MSRHTPGPWRANGQVGEIQGANHERVVYMNVKMNPHDVALIAAAPDLLMALEMVLDELAVQAGLEHLTADSGTRIVYDKARAAIAKARGES